MSNLGRWAPWYIGLERDGPQPYGASDSYQILADWVADCDTVEDWGCGKGWMRTVIDADRYTGVDGTNSPFADVVADLVRYQSSPDGIVMRHVLEHEPRWEQVLNNAVASFGQRFGLALFTPLADRTTQIAWNRGVEVPDISFAESDIVDVFCDADCSWHRVVVEPSPTQYGIEHMYLVERN